MLRLIPLLLVVIVLGCEPNPPAEAPEPPADTVMPSEEAITSRIAEARERLDSTEAGRFVWQAIEAHGGLQAWWSNGPLYFRFDYQPVGGEGIDTYELVDTWSSRARHWLASDTTVSFGWDGAQAWTHPAGAEVPTNARFWSLTPYYFVAVPFVLADPGVQHTMDGTMTFEDKTYDLVRITFASGTGDAPDDYYVILLDPNTRLVRGLRYIVSYPGYFPDGGHSPEKLMMYDGEQTVDGITLAERFRAFPWNDGDPGDLVTEVSITDVDFRPETPKDAFEMPAGAEVQEDM
jgi:hypothetical protein